MNLPRTMFRAPEIARAVVFQLQHSRGMGKMDRIVYSLVRNKRNSKPKFPVILLEDNEKLGAKGDIVKVERGFARMHLIPGGIATYATPENREKFASTTSGEARATVHPKLIRYLEQVQLRLRRADDCFFEVDSHQLSAEFKKVNLHVPPECITLSDPMTTQGDYVVKVTINKTVEVPVQVSVGVADDIAMPARYRKALEGGQTGDAADTTC